MHEEDADRPALYQTIGFFLGPIAALAIAFLVPPDLMPEAARHVAALGALIAIWWATEAIPVPVTSLLPLVAFPVVGLTSFEDAAAPFAHPIIYLFLGGFIIAIAIERCGLHRRIALNVFKAAGTDARSLVGGFMLAAALVSMWTSNSSTTLMLLPIALSVVAVIAETMPDISRREQANFGLAMLLGLAYAATIGGMATLVGTPTNAFLAGFMKETYNVEIGFGSWMLIGIPVMLVLLPCTWFLLVRVLVPVKFKSSPEALRHIGALRDGLGRMSKAETRVAVLFAFMVAAWIFRGPLVELTNAPGLTDAGIAMTAGFLTFIIPSGERSRPLLRWQDMDRLPWGVLLLFGGGLALADAVASSGLATWIGAQLAPLGGTNVSILIIASTALVIFLTELTSNVATAATFLPVVAAIAVEAGLDPLLFAIPVALAASAAFMLPVATPPNAIVFSSGLISIPQMVRAGFLLNIISIAVVSAVALYLVPLVF